MLFAGFLLHYSDLIVLILASLLFTFVLVICWRSTTLAPLNYNLWLIQIQEIPHRRILRIVQMTENPSQDFDPSPLNTPSDLGENQGHATEEITNLLLIQTPTSIGQDVPIQVSAQAREQSEAGEEPLINHQHDNNLQQYGDEDDGAHGLRTSTAVETQYEAITNNMAESSSEMFTIRLKFLDDTQQLIQTHKNTPVGLFKRQHFSEHLATGKTVRLIFQGRLLRDDRSTLCSYGLHDECVVHCHIGTRPYAATSENENRGHVVEGGNAPPQNDAPLIGGSTLGARLTTGTWFDLLLLYAWSFIMAAWEWANRAEEVPADNQSLLVRTRAQIRSILRLFLDILFGSSIRNAQRRNGNDASRYNVGQLLALLIFVKFLLLWTFVLLYPQFTDRRSMFLLSMLTATTGLYFYFNRTHRANAPAPQARREQH